MMHRRKFLQLTLGGASLAAAGWPRRAMGARLAASVRLAPGTARALPPGGLLGMDGLLINFNHPWIDQNGLLKAFQDSKFSLLRYPGRGVADVWNWHSGWLDQNTTLTPSLPYVLQQLQTISDRQYPLSDLNVPGRPVIFTPSMACGNLRLNEEPLKAPIEAAAPALVHTLNALAEASQQGIAIDWIELGEAYTQETFAQETIWNGSLGQKLFDGGENKPPCGYPAVAAHWSHSLHQVRPSAKIAFHGASFLTPSVEDPIIANWNMHAWQTLAEQSAVDAMAVQLFLPANLGVNSNNPDNIWGTPQEQSDQYAALQDPQVLAGFLSEADQYLGRYLTNGAGAGLTTTRFNLMVSAFNVYDPIGGLRHTWAHGLAIAALLNAFLREPRVALAVLHNLADQPHAALLLTRYQFDGLMLENFVDLNHLQASLMQDSIAPAGRVADLFAGLMAGMHTALPLCAEEPADPLLWGWLFTDSRAVRANILLANLTPNPVLVECGQILQALPFIPDEVSLTTWQAEPSQFITGVNNSDFSAFSLSRSQQTTPKDGQLLLPSYSLSSAWQLTPSKLGKSFIHLPLIQNKRSP